MAELDGPSWAESLAIKFPEALPITPALDTIADALSRHRVVIVAGATGSGKTTQLPKLALKLGFGRHGRIGCTQPRRLAASSLAARVAAELEVECGNEVGYKVRFDDRTSARTVVKFMTDGILLAETRSDFLLRQYDCILLDEVHERSLNVDFLLGFLKNLLKKRTDLKLLISSATLEAERFSAFFDGAPFVEIPGALFPVEDYYMPTEPEEELSAQLARAVNFLSELDGRGDILAFLPGEREIRDALELLTGRNLRHTEVLALYGRLGAGEQNRIFKPGRLRRIILATNVAETSITIPGIRYVIDSGQVRLARYNPRTRIQELRVESISQASMRQRRGRCGRLADGICVHLYSETEAAEFDEYTEPEIRRTALSGVILQMAALRLPPIERFPFVDAPAAGLIREGVRTLKDLGALDDVTGQLTALGRQLAALPIDPHLGRMILAGVERKVAFETTVIAAFLSIPDPRERPIDKAAQADAAQRKFASESSDFIGILKLYDAMRELESTGALRRFARDNYLNFRRLREWRNLVDDLSGWFELPPDEPGRKLAENLPADAVHMAILSGLPRQLAFFDREEKNYIDMNNQRFRIFPGSGLARRKTPPAWLFSFAVVETSMRFARQNAEARPEWLEAVAPWLCTKSYDQVRYDPDSGFVYARERLTAGRLLIHPGRSRHYGDIDPVAARKVFIREGLLTGALPERTGWSKRYRDRLDRLRALELKVRRPGLLLDFEAIYRHFDAVLPPEIVSARALKLDWERHKRDYTPDEAVMLQEGAERYLEFADEYVDFLSFAGVKFPLYYRFDPGETADGLTLAVPENELNIIPGWALDHLPGELLAEKLELWLKALDKESRRVLAPLSGTIAAFMADYRARKLVREQPLATLLGDWLAHYFELNVGARDFENVRLPEYLVLKLALIDPETHRIVAVHREVPGAGTLGSELSAALPGVEIWKRSGCSHWPDTPALPESVPLTRHGDSVGYLALTDEESGVGVAIYLKVAEARRRHDAGLARLLKLQLGGLLKLIRRDFRNFPTLFGRMTETAWRDALLDATLRAALGDAETRWQIRSQAAFDRAREAVRMRVARCATELNDTLKTLTGQLSTVQKLLTRFPADGFTRSDAEAQVRFLLREGFLNDEAALVRYPRYFRGLELRLQRAVADRAKDEMKGAELAAFLERFRLAVTACELADSPELGEYALLLEEARLGRYAPEIRPLEKNTVAILKERWDKLRY